MTVFDRLEAQLAGAHPRRRRRALPRPEPRPLLVFALSAAAVALVVVLALAGGGDTRSAPRTPGAVAAPPPPSEITVAVLNAGAPAGTAGRIAMRLADAGFRIREVSNSASRDCTGYVVYFTHGDSAAAFRVADALPGSTLVPADASISRAGKGADVVVLVGKPTS